MPHLAESTPSSSAADLYSPIIHEDMQEIISHPPAWLVRWGTAVLLAVVASVVLLSYLIWYPERLTAPMRLTSAAPPLTISTQAAGRLATLLIQDKQFVKKGQPLGYFETTASFEQVQRLRAQLTTLRAQATQLGRTTAPQLATADYEQLGDLEDRFIAFKKAQAAYLATSPAGLENYLQALDALRQAGAEWQRVNVLTAPATGRVRLAAGLAAGQETPAQQVLFYLIPTRVATGIYGEITVTQAQATSLREGQEVAVRIMGYQAANVGLVRGRLAAIAEVPSAQGTLQVRVALPTGLRTTYNKTLPYRPGMQAVAEVTIKKLRLLDRILDFISS